jgi:hypothetical protein
LLDFLSTYPQVDEKIFFNAPLEEQTIVDISNELRKFINGKRSSEAIDFILKFVQKAFAYEVDTQQFGKQKMMFAQETLYYDKSDSEDRAILFTYLIRKLLGFSIIGIKYANHTSTALYIPMDGDSVNVYGKKFIIADPTYVNAAIGESISRYKYKKPSKFIDQN